MILSIILQESSSSLIDMIGITGVIIYLALVIFMIAAFWKIFTKASQPGWASIIPVYSMVVFFRIIGRPTSRIWTYLGLIIAYAAGLTMMMNGASIGALLTAGGSITLLVLLIIDTNRLSRSFGKDGGFTAGLIFLGFIFYPILAFGDARYIGPNGVGEVENDVNPDILHA